MNYSIIHADRDFRYHEKLKELLAPYGELVFKEHCCYLDSALQLLKPLQTDIVITGSKLYDEANAVEALCQYRDVHMPQLKIIVLTSKEDTDHLLNSIVAGVNGYISKSCAIEEIYECIHDVGNGDHYLGIQKLGIKKI